jgi:hypothetical protein
MKYIYNVIKLGTEHRLLISSIDNEGNEYFHGSYPLDGKDEFIMREIGKIHDILEEIQENLKNQSNH